VTESEVEQCNRIREWAERLGFEVYPEVAGWDLVLVGAAPVKLTRHVVEAGAQVGIHAKMRANCDVLAQAVHEHGAHPAYALVAVPDAGPAFTRVARKLGLGVLTTDQKPSYGARDVRVREWPSRGDHPPLTLPPVASRCIVAGAPSPRVLSPWRVKALGFLAWARTRASFTVTDLAGHGLSKSWVERWGEAVDWTTEVRRGKTVRVRTYALTSRAERLPDWGYTDVAAELAASATRGA
jgi:hypothetical protein